MFGTSSPSLRPIRARTQSRLPFAKPSSIRTALLAAAVVLAVAALVLALFSSLGPLSLAALVTALAAAAPPPPYPIVRGRGPHRRNQDQLPAPARLPQAPLQS